LMKANPHQRELVGVFFACTEIDGIC